MDVISIILTLVFGWPLLHRLCICILCWILEKLLTTEVKIETLGLFCLREIKVFYPRYILEINKISFRFFINGRRKIFCICFNEVNVKLREDEGVTNRVNPAHQCSKIQCHIPPQLAAYSKWIAVEVNDLNIRFKLPDQHLVCFSAAKADLYFQQHDVNEWLVAKAHLQTNVVAGSTTTENAQALPNDFSAEHLLQLLINVAIEITLVLTDDSFSIQRISVQVDSIDVEIKEQLGVLIFEKCCQTADIRQKHPTTDYQPSTVTNQSLEDVIYYFSPVIPKNFHLGIHNVEVSGMKGSPSPYVISVLSCTIDTAFKLSDIMDQSGNQDITSLNPCVSIEFCLNNMDMEINLLEAIKIGEFSMNGKLMNKELISDVMLKSVDVNYYHEELVHWLQANFKKPLLIQENNRNASQDNDYSSQSLNGRFLSEVNILVHMSHFTAKYYESPIQASETASFSLDYIKLKYEASHDLRKNDLRMYEMIVSKLRCHLGHMPSDLALQRDKYHTWGTLLFVGVLSMHFPREEQVQVLLSSVQMEWTPSVPKVALAAVRHMVNLHKTISNLCKIQEVEVEPIWSQGTRTMNFTIRDCNVYLCDDLDQKMLKKRDSCYMLRFDTMMSHISPTEISYEIDGLKAITILEERVGQHACTSSRQLKGYWLYLKKISGISYRPFGEMNVMLREEIKLFWNQGLHARFSAIITSIQDFNRSLHEIARPSDSNNQMIAQSSMSMTINAECQAKVVVDIFKSSTQLHIYFSDAFYISTSTERCIKAHISRLEFLKGAILGLNTASFCALYNQCVNGYIQHRESNTSLYLSLDPKLQSTISLVIFCEILCLFIYLM